ncbi:MAG TPA: Calx-beta domain-containing protein [Polyangiaceae bacterium]|nr:Calx-beta domain-containing protein [Polyangiaceae bacterium]
MSVAARRGAWLPMALAIGSFGCAPVEDVVFETLALVPPTTPVVVREGVGVVELPIRLNSAPHNAVTAGYRLEEREAQDGCQVPDFLSAEGTVSWAAGSREAMVSFWVGDDDVAEIDERLTLTLSNIEGAVLLGPTAIPLLIEDDDRDAIIDARAEFGLTPGLAVDQSAALQSALDRAARSGRGVVLLAPGDYEIHGVSLTSGTTLSGRGASLHRLAHAPDDRALLAVAYAGAGDSLPTLIEGVTLDGRRDQQVDYRAGEGNDAHLLSLAADAGRPSRLRASIESVTLDEATGSGVFIGPESDVRLCRLRGSNLWRDIVTLRGGGSSLDVRELDASASIGTTGMWFGGQPEGYGGVRTIQVKLSDARLASGDLEIEGYGGSVVDIERLSMTRGPLRIQAPNARVRIVDSVLESGLPSALHNFWGSPHDVEVTRTTLVVSETDDEGMEAAEADRSLATVSVRWEVDGDSSAAAAAASGPHQLVFDHCLFQGGRDIETSDQVYAVASDGTAGSVLLRAAILGSGVEALFPPCTACSVEPSN